LRYTIATSPPSTSLDFDHFFGLSVLLDRFPGTRAIASPKSVKLMHEQLQTAAFAPRGTARSAESSCSSGWLV
jgi:hypothetical protein